MTSPFPIPSLPGYHGRYLRIDLSAAHATEVTLDESALRRFLGGSGLGTYLLLTEAAATVDPLSPESPLAFVFSPLVGSPLTTSAKFAVVGKSPLTNRINDSLVSSQFAITGKRTGYDALVLVGRAREPSVVIVSNGRLTLQPADELWGLECPEAERRLRDTLGADYSAAVIGPAGERGVRYATISHDGRHAGRGGSGAVLGAKNVKAVAVRGSARVRWADPDGLFAAAKDISRRSFGPATAKYRELGTASNLLLFNRLAALPTRNFQQGSFEHAADLAPERLAETRSKSQKSCAGCTIGCEHLYGINGDKGNGETKGAASVRVEYENLFALGSLCGIGDSNAVLEASRRCDALGLDTISAGGTIAFAMECAERGLIDAEWLRFGDASALLRALDEIASRTGLGDLLAEGSRRAALSIGGDSIAFAPQVKGMEIPGYEPRALQTMALGFAVASRGADHNRSGAYEIDFSPSNDRRHPGPDAARGAVETEDRAAVMDSLILCKFLRNVFDDYYGELAGLLNLVTGWDTTADELRATARRIVAARKLYNIRAGWQPEDDTLPERFLDQPLADDSEAVLGGGQLREMIAGYNATRGWTPEGWIPPELLESLRLSDL